MHQFFLNMKWTGDCSHCWLAVKTHYVLSLFYLMGLCTETILWNLHHSLVLSNTDWIDWLWALVLFDFGLNHSIIEIKNSLVVGWFKKETVRPVEIWWWWRWRTCLGCGQGVMWVCGHAGIPTQHLFLWPRWQLWVCGMDSPPDWDTWRWHRQSAHGVFGMFTHLYSDRLFESKFIFPCFVWIYFLCERPWRQQLPTWGWSTGPVQGGCWAGRCSTDPASTDAPTLSDD